MTPIEHRNILKETKRKMMLGQATIDEVYTAADEYIAALKRYKKETGKKLSIPSRPYLIRVI